MSLSCECDWDFGYEPEPGQWQFDYYTGTELDFKLFKHWRAKRCISCDNLIYMDNICLEFARVRQPYTEVEARFHGIDWEELMDPTIKMASVYHCEKCGEIYLNLDSVGFKCIDPGESMQKLLEQYQHDYSPKKLNQG